MQEYGTCLFYKQPPPPRHLRKSQCTRVHPVNFCDFCDFRLIIGFYNLCAILLKSTLVIEHLAILKDPDHFLFVSGYINLLHSFECFAWTKKIYPAVITTIVGVVRDGALDLMLGVLISITFSQELTNYMQIIFFWGRIKYDAWRT